MIQETLAKCFPYPIILLIDKPLACDYSSKIICHVCYDLQEMDDDNDGPDVELTDASENVLNAEQDVLDFYEVVPYEFYI